jgi:hypothetical protein
MKLTFERDGCEGAADYFLRLQRLQQQDRIRPILNDEERSLLDSRLQVAALRAKVEVGDLRLLSANGWLALKAASEATESQAVLECKEAIKELVHGCPDALVVWNWFRHGMADRLEPDETDATLICKLKIADLVESLSLRDRDAILLWPRLSMPDQQDLHLIF